MNGPGMTSAGGLLRSDSSRSPQSAGRCVPSSVSTLVRREGHPADSPAELTRQSQSPGAFSFPQRWRRTPRSCRARSASWMPHRNSTRARRPRCSSVPACSSWPPSSPPWWLAESGAGPRRLPIVAPSTAARWSRRPCPDGFPAPPRRRRPELRSSSPQPASPPWRRHCQAPRPRERRARAVRRVGRRGTRPTAEGAPAPSSSSEAQTTAAHPTASTRTTTPRAQRSPASEAVPTTSRSAPRRRRPLPVQHRRLSLGQRRAQLPVRHRCPRPNARTTPRATPQ